MSYSFQRWDADERLWNPSNGPGRTYAGIARVIAAHPDVPGLESWLTPSNPPETADDYYIDAKEMATFLRAVLDSSVVSNQSFRALARGFLEFSLAMLFRAGENVEAKSEYQAELIDAGRELARNMLR